MPITSSMVHEETWLPVRYRFTITSYACNGYGDFGRIAIVVKTRTIIAVLVKLGIGIPIKRSSIIFHFIRWGSIRIIGMIKVIWLIYTGKDHPSITESRAHSVIEQTTIVNGYVIIVAYTVVLGMHHWNVLIAQFKIRKDMNSLESFQFDFPKTHTVVTAYFHDFYFFPSGIRAVFVNALQISQVIVDAILYSGANAVVSDVAGLKAMVANDQPEVKVAMNSNLSIDNSFSVPADKKVVLDLGGNTLNVAGNDVNIIGELVIEGNGNV